jgi:hypothetical protein
MIAVFYHSVPILSKVPARQYRPNNSFVYRWQKCIPPYSERESPSAFINAVWANGKIKQTLKMTVLRTN